MGQVDVRVAVRTLARRFRARDTYRLRRDRKIAVDWIGREFDHQSGSKWRLLSYNPNNHTVKVCGVGGPSVAMSTDAFWRLLWSGELLP